MKTDQPNTREKHWLESVVELGCVFDGKPAQIARAPRLHAEKAPAWLRDKLLLSTHHRFMRQWAVRDGTP